MSHIGPKIPTIYIKGSQTKTVIIKKLQYVFFYFQYHRIIGYQDWDSKVKANMKNRAAMRQVRDIFFKNRPVLDAFFHLFHKYPLNF